MNVMNYFKNLIVFMCLIVLSGTVSGADLKGDFLNPPQDALPRGYWLWPHGNFDYSTIKSELKAFKEMGLGGVDIFDLGVRDRNDVIPEGPGFMSPQQVDAIAFALQEAQKLDLQIGLIVSSSWNAGASWTKPEEGLMHLVSWSESVTGPTTYNKKIPFPEIQDSFKKPYGEYKLHVPKDQNGLPQYYKEIALIAFPVSSNQTILDTDSILNLTGQLNEHGEVSVDLPEGEWVILRAVCTNFGQRLWLPSDNSEGLIMDHFSKTVTRNHFQTIIDRLEERIGSVKDTALERLYLCSYESDAPIVWTPLMSEEFEARNGYSLDQYMPALFGYVVKDQNHTDRFLYDFRRTVSDVFVENLYVEASSICRENGLLLCSESGGPGPPLHDVPTEDLKALGAVDVMRGEFWNRATPWKDEDGFNLMQVVKGIASAAHIYGDKIVEMEAFTSHIHWQEGPDLFKDLADRAFCEGMNRVVYHTMSHNLPEAGKPGWTYQAGTHVNTNLTWWPMSSHLHSYMARTSAMLQSGRFVADAVYYYGHEIPNFAKPKHVRPDLGPGYDYDDVNTQVLLTADVKDGRIILPSGMEYEVLVLPNSNQMDLAVMRQILSLLQKGATIIGTRPTEIYGLIGYPEDERILNRMADMIWGEGGLSTIDHQIGKGRIINGKTTREVLMEKGVGPDIQIVGAEYEQIDTIHRKTENEEIYFIRNTTESPISIDVSFRVKNKTPEFWDPVSGAITPAAVYHVEDNEIRLPIHFEQHGSIFIVFTDQTTKAQYIKTVYKNDRLIFPLAPQFKTQSFRLLRS